MARKQVQISLPEEILKWLDEYCEKFYLTRSEAIKNFIITNRIAPEEQKKFEEG